jgi:hypothetical protein
MGARRNLLQAPALLLSIIGHTFTQQVDQQVRLLTLGGVDDGSRVLPQAAMATCPRIAQKPVPGLRSS